MSEMVTVKVRGRYHKQEEQPYRECPNCGKYDYRTIVIEEHFSKGIYRLINIFSVVKIGGEWRETARYDSCDNCQFKVRE